VNFDLGGAGVVITGGGGGIGAALARSFAEQGARVVVADVDGEAVTAVAAEIGGVAIVGDAAGESGVEHLIAAATDELGAIDLYCANAGVAPVGGADAAGADWERAWNVNVMAHVRAAKHLVPGWLERGHGHFLATVSAAGLLTMPGSAPYAVTKHGALAFAEWLSATYRHRGVTVQVLCPQGVRTKMLADTGPVGQLVMGASAIDPEQVAEEVLKALRDGRFLILPHPEVADYYVARATDTDRWLNGMNKLQRKIEALDE
jgi:NAD(P)-dependent dehydrogenase (short-subunit alcohol dehydrogenase family)